MNCYNEFAHIYDRLINSDINYEKWAEIMIKICEKYKVNKKNYLDLACGTGNMTNLIGKSFINTWAIDLSEEMLSEAEEKLRKNGIKAKFVCQNICNFNLNRKFNLITCCLDSTNYILAKEELLNYFKCTYEHLEDDGIFIFDINSYYKLKEILGNNTYNYDDDDVIYIWENVFSDDIVDMYLTFFIKEGELYRRFDEEHSERAYSEETIEELLNEVGLEVLEKLNNYEGNDIKEDSERIVYVVRKNKNIGGINKCQIN